ncbi:DUF2200 domain-containing protein [Aquimarina agarivorans]|uniref:DUF2200 domain-containing protein n=1 Tax=Aquimarina agarivorans TaxID=980584 RepID=UPI000248EC65|nr:DUF2200 domain-containing protein [Aquimarina agarivorans]
MEVTAAKNKKIEAMTFASVYPHYVAKVIKKGRTEAELIQVIEWLTGFNATNINKCIKEKWTFKVFFERANIHPKAHLITGTICGYRIETISDEFKVYKQCRYLDKLVDELAKNRKIEKIFRE